MARGAIVGFTGHHANQRANGENGARHKADGLDDRNHVGAVRLVQGHPRRLFARPDA
jgi:hypothetical protein